MGDNITNLLQFWHQQPVLQIVTLAHSPACDSGSSAEMLRQSHWKTQIEGLTKQQLVPFSVHRARVCIRGSRWDQCHDPPYFFVPRAINVLPPPPEQRIHPTGPPPHRSNFPKGLRCRQEQFRARFFARCGCRCRCQITPLQLPPLLQTSLSWHLPHQTIFSKVFFRGFVAADGDFECNLDAVANGGASDGGDGSWVRW